MNHTKIETCDLSWNPITGCLHDCWFCYAKTNYHRFHRDFKPTPVEPTLPTPPPCVYLVISNLEGETRRLRQCRHPKFLDKIAGLGEIPKGPPKCLFTDEYLRDCAWYDSGIVGDKRALKAKPVGD